jgi:hypothetical protein
MSQTLRADDQVLLLDIPSTRELTSMARVLMRGAIVALGSADEVDRARREMAEFDNVLFLDASPAAIPWRDGYFSKIIVPPHLEPLLAQVAHEIQRVLRPDGMVVRITIDA